MEPNMEYIVAQVTQKEVGRRFQVGPEIIDYILDRQESHDLEHDQSMLDRMVDSLATSWVNASNFKVALLGMDIVSALVTRLQERFKTQIGTVLPSLIDRLGDSKDQVRDQAQSLLLKIMDQAANPQYVWDRMLAGFRHKNNRTREAVCFCLIATLNVSGAHGLTLSKIVPHICHLLGDPASQVRDGAMNCLVEIYRHVGERVRVDLGKKGLPQSRLNVIFSRFDEVQRSGNMILSSDKNMDDEDSVDGGRSSSSVRRTGSLRRPSSASSTKSSGKESSAAGAVDEEDFIRAFEDVPAVQIYSARELEDSMNKIRETLSDDKHDWEQRVAALKKVRSLLLAGASKYDGFLQQLRQLEGPLKLSAKDLRSQVVREACITLGHLSSVLGNKFDHGAENIMPTLLNLVPNSAKVMATSGMAAIRLIIRHTHYPRLIPIMTSNCTSKSVVVRRRCYEFLDLLLQEWQKNSLERHIAVLMETIKKGVNDADSEARSVARKCYWGFHAHFSKEAEHLFQALELTYQKALQSHLKSSDSIMSLPQSDHSSSSSQESLNRLLSAKTPVGSNLSKTKVVSSRASSSSGSLQRSHSDVDVNAVASAKSRMPAVAATAPFSSAAALPPGSYASLDAAGNVEAKVVSSRASSSSGSLQRSHSDVDVNAVASAKSRMPAVAATAPFSSAAALPPGSYASLDAAGNVEGRVRTRRQSSEMAAGGGASVTDSRGRSRAKAVSQSQRSRSANPVVGKTHAGSRSSSPGKLLARSSMRIPRSAGSAGAPLDKRSKIPCNQGCSRETSPSRARNVRASRIPRPSMSQGCSRDTSRESSRDTSPARGFSLLASHRHSRSTSALTAGDVLQTDRFGLIHQAMRILNTGTEVEAAVADALLLGDSRNKRRPMRRRYESPGMYSDDDANSDASSACSERSFSSRNSAAPHYLRQTEDVAEILNHCASSNCSERKEGLLGLQNLLKSQRVLSRVELKRLCEIFTRMFADPHSKNVLSMFLETLVDFIMLHREDLQDWLFILLTQLLKKMGADLLGSVQAKVQRALDVTRDSFPYDQQFNILMRFIVDQTQTPNLKVKVAILKYIESLARQMDPSDFVNSSETRLAVSRIITWTTEPKSSDVRKTLHIWLNEEASGRSSTVASLPGESNLEERCKQVSQASPSGSSIVGRTPPRHPVTRSSPLTSPTNGSHGGLSPSRLFGRSSKPSSNLPPPHPGPATPPLWTYRRAYSPSMLECNTENMNSEEIFSSLRGVTEAIQSFSFRSQEDILEPIKHDGKREDTTGVDPRLSAGVMEGGRTALDNKTSLLNTPSPRSWAREYNPYNYSDSISAYEKGALAVFDDVEHIRDDHPQDCGENKIMHSKGFSAGPRQHLEMIGDLLKELSNHSERVEERRAALLELLKVTRDDSLAVWEEHFKTMLLLLLETLGDRDHTIRALALRVLKEIMRSQPARFKNYAELTIMKTLEAHKDCHKEVVRAAEETASTLAGSIHSEQCIKVLCPIIQTADYPINLAAIKMQTKVIERIPQDSLIQLLPDIIPGLLQGYDNTESSVRKASVFCLVAIYSVIGEDLKPHLQQLTGSKMKLLNLYIKRAQTTNSNSSSSSDVSSHS
ncbi:CLIP-associating protein 1-like [Sinocyclocheilus anshuiensis]|uniref:CLIP-associating protein 1-like n=1 Tax=Sinocyclocheilus anshuiensis TaxID=1608454 RepID=UPI0007BAA76F|nr:PREDICTED: CLIP-associating protein 1-like [Sinocyclocheilus anshuiensis]